MDIFTIVAAFFSGLLGALGLGGGSVLIIFLTMLSDVPQHTAQGINLVFFIPCALIAIVMHLKNKLIDKKLWLIAVIPAAVLCVGSSFLSGVLPADTLRKIFAVFLIFYGCNELLARKKKNDTITAGDKKNEE